MKTCKVILQDEVYCKILGLSDEDNRFLWNQFGIEVEGAFFMPAVKLGRWDGKIRFFDATGKTYIRLLEEILPFIVGWGYDINIDDKRIPFPQPEARLSENHFAKFLGYGGRPIQVRPYQCDCVNAAVDASSGFIIAGTGAGKTLMNAGLCDMYGLEGYKTITIVPSADLIVQTVDAFKMVGLDVGSYGGGNKELDHQHIVATWQSLQNNPGVMKMFQVAIVDEAHGAKASVIQKLMNDYGGHIPFRFGFTGTFPKNEADQVSLRSTIGPILHEIKSSWLIENGYLAKIDIEAIQTQESADLPDYPSERAFLARSEDRLKVLSNLIQAKMKEFGNTLVLVSSVQFGKKLQKLIPNSVFLSGESANDLRQENYKQYAERDDVIVIATFGIASTGISIDRIFCEIMIDAGKSFIKAIQSVGRGLRKGGDKNYIHVVDVSSSLKYSKKHQKERMKYYKEAGYPTSKIIKIKY